jgi:hypothetical protein
MTKRGNKMTGCLMTREEMLKRLKSGESPLELSIDKWNRIVDAHRSGKTVDYEFYCGRTCALCEVFRKDIVTNPCVDCPYYRFYGIACDDKVKGHWFEYSYIHTCSNVVLENSAVDMKNALIKIKLGELKKKIEELKIDELILDNVCEGMSCEECPMYNLKICCPIYSNYKFFN